jgi:hypothetical protein
MIAGSPLTRLNDPEVCQAMNKRRRKRRGPKKRAIFIAPSEAQRPLISEDGTIYLPPVLVPEQLAALLQCSRQHVTQHCRKGTIKAQRVGSLWFIGRGEAQRLLGTAGIAAK